MRRFMKTAGLAVAFAAMLVSSASATTGPAMLTSTTPFGTGSNTGALSGNASTYTSHVFTAGGGAVKLQCTDANFKITGVTTNTAHFDPSYGSGCTYAVSGTVLGSFSVDTSSSWTLLLHHATYNNSTGAGTDITVTSSPTKITIPGIGCTIDLLHQTHGGIAAQNITQTGVSTSVESPHPWGVRIDANVSSLTYTTTGTCPGLPEHGSDGGYVGSVAIPNVWGML